MNHLPSTGAIIRYMGELWTVQVSRPQNPTISIWRSPNHNIHIPWRTAPFTIIRTNNLNDYDMRENDKGAAQGPKDEYTRLSQLEKSLKIRGKFEQAKQQALRMIKTFTQPHVNQASLASLNAIIVEDFSVTAKGPTLLGAGKNEEPAEWHFTWIEGNETNTRRTWHFVIDSDNPLETSSQEPHVGWTVSALAGSQPGVPNTFGHIWLDFVPVRR